MSKRYFKRPAESELGMGMVWLEFDGDTPTRQVERYRRQAGDTSRELKASVECAG